MLCLAWSLVLARICTSSEPSVVGLGACSCMQHVHGRD
jgi:hypothetical protein